MLPLQARRPPLSPGGAVQAAATLAVPHRLAFGSDHHKASIRGNSHSPTSSLFFLELHCQAPLLPEWEVVFSTSGTCHQVLGLSVQRRRSKAATVISFTITAEGSGD